MNIFWKPLFADSFFFHILDIILYFPPSKIKQKHSELFDSKNLLGPQKYKKTSQTPPKDDGTKLKSFFPSFSLSFVLSKRALCFV